MIYGELRPGSLVRFVLPCRRHRLHLCAGTVVADLSVCVVVDVPREKSTPIRQVVWRSNLRSVVEVLS